MKKALTLLAIIFFSFQSPMYGPWEKTIIDDDINFGVTVDFADLNNDNKPDLVAHSWVGGGIYWYQNNYPEWIRRDISTDRATFVFTGDMDGDNIPDVVACLAADKKMV